MTNLEIDNEINEIVEILKDAQNDPSICVELVYMALIDWQIRMRKKRLSITKT